MPEIRLFNRDRRPLTMHIRANFWRCFLTGQRVRYNDRLSVLEL